MPDRRTLAYCFGNHMHWVDMEWLWGYHVLPGSAADMLKFCAETGTKGCVNFDGIGYEKLAAEAPEALADLRRAVQDGVIEPVGCSYGQPYGLFQGGESNVRQRVYGARSVMRLLGVRPKTFWEEEFDFFPQLQQMLAGCGFTGASLYFQWTWHTPEVPVEEASVVLWEGLDGTRLPAATRNRLNLHQWPEDFRILLDELSAAQPPPEASGAVPPLILQWLELMPSPDWMCRAELMVPVLKELMADPRFEVKPTTLGGYLGATPTESLPVRRYGLDDVWHGLTLGKNGDFMRRLSAQCERELLNAEALASIAGVFGRPYAQWDVYPVWELEEAWRELLAAQHHDNDECEGLCGRFGKLQYRRAQSMAEETIRRTLRALGLTPIENTLSDLHNLNPFGWNTLGANGKRDCPPLSLTKTSCCARPVGQHFDDEAARMTPSNRDQELSHEVDLRAGLVTRLAQRGGQEAVSRPLGRLHVSGQPLHVCRSAWQDIDGQHVWAHYCVDETSGDADYRLEIKRSYPHAGLDLTVSDIDGLIPRIGAGLNGALTIEFPLPSPTCHVWADSAYAIEQVRTGSSGRRKYPEGDWMTSPQWFEVVSGAFTSLGLVDMVDPDTGEGLLIVHNGMQQWFLEPDGVRCVLAAHDPWDEGYFQKKPDWLEDEDVWSMNAEFRLIPHGRIKDSERWMTVQEFRLGREGLFHLPRDGDSPIPSGFSFLQCSPENVVVTALYRESEDYSGRDLENYAGRGMGYPYVLRLVEFDGLESEVDLNIVGPIAKAYKTNLLGEIEDELVPAKGDIKRISPQTKELKAFGIEAARLKFKMRPYEISTLYLDIVPGRKQTRDLDAKRDVWATVHRTDPDRP